MKRRWSRIVCAGGCEKFRGRPPHSFLTAVGLDPHALRAHSCGYLKPDRRIPTDDKGECCRVHDFRKSSFKIIAIKFREVDEFEV